MSSGEERDPLSQPISGGGWTTAISYWVRMSAAQQLFGQEYTATTPKSRVSPISRAAAAAASSAALALGADREPVIAVAPGNRGLSAKMPGISWHSNSRRAPQSSQCGTDDKGTGVMRDAVAPAVEWFPRTRLVAPQSLTVLNVDVDTDTSRSTGNGKVHHSGEPP